MQAQSLSRDDALLATRLATAGDKARKQVAAAASQAGGPLQAIASGVWPIPQLDGDGDVDGEDCCAAVALSESQQNSAQQKSAEAGPALESGSAAVCISVRAARMAAEQLGDILEWQKLLAGDRAQVSRDCSPLLRAVEVLPAEIKRLMLPLAVRVQDLVWRIQRIDAAYVRAVHQGEAVSEVDRLWEEGFKASQELRAGVSRMRCQLSRDVTEEKDTNEPEDARAKSPGFHELETHMMPSSHEDTHCRGPRQVGQGRDVPSRGAEPEIIGRGDTEEESHDEQVSSELAHRPSRARCTSSQGRPESGSQQQPQQRQEVLIRRELGQSSVDAILEGELGKNGKEDVGQYRIETPASEDLVSVGLDGLPKSNTARFFDVQEEAGGLQGRSKIEKAVQEWFEVVRTKNPNADNLTEQILQVNDLVKMWHEDLSAESLRTGTFIKNGIHTEVEMTIGVVSRYLPNA